MKTNILLIILFLCACLTAKAQTPDSLAHYRHSLGITINPIYGQYGFRSKHPISIGLIYRYQYEIDKALRIGGSGSYETRSYLTTLKSNPIPQDSLFITKLFEIAVGHEWQYQINSSFSSGFGIDVAPFLYTRQNKIDNILIGENVLLNEKIKRDYKITGLALQPLLNVKFSISPRIFFAIECKASISYSKEKYSATGSYGDVKERLEDRGIISGGAKREKITFNAQPISSLQLNFRL